MSNKLLTAIGATLIALGLAYYSIQNKNETLATHHDFGSQKKPNAMLAGEDSKAVGISYSDGRKDVAEQNVEENSVSTADAEILTDKELAEFAVEKITEVDFGLRPDRYSIEQLTILGKYFKGMALTPEELEINFTYFLDITFRLKNENPDSNIFSYEYDAPEKWVAAHAYNDGFKYWFSLLEDGDVMAGKLLGGYHLQANYTEDAIQIYTATLPHLENIEDRGYVTMQLARALTEKNPLLAATFYKLSVFSFNSNLTHPELQSLLEKYDHDAIEAQMTKIVEDYGW